MILFVTLVLFITAIQGNAGRDNTPVAHKEWILPSIQIAHDDSITEVVKGGETAGLVLAKLGFPASEVANIIKAASTVYNLKNVSIGHKFQKNISKNDITITYQVNAKEQLLLATQPGQAWQAEMISRPVFPRTNMVEGVIQDSLFYDAAQAGLEDALTIKLVDIFAWDIDFVRDLRKGDTFKVLYEEAFDDEGKRVGYTILSAEFINRGHVYTAIRYKDKKGNIEYYDQEGRNLRKTYLKSPVRYSRISSRFSLSRKHPVLGYTRAHRGVDYAAKSGTPIHTIGDGRVVYKGWKGGYGRFIEIRHTNGIDSTAYAHMRRYAKGIRKGSYVKQGQIIGYVGMSGLATGPHLHFEFRLRGRAVNPLRVKHKAAQPVPKNEITAFRLKAKKMMQIMVTQSQLNAWG
ncbi:MAG: peptidoglycan DD-metalloendopeptidase family protein [Ghiorsea sp.]|nr:peptidoglycan DD-metalloendopeptidase family protein [Ghiorsea sp.]